MALAGALLGVVVLFSDVCKTFGSGVFQTFNGTLFHVKSTCPFTLTRFTFAGVDCSITVQREPTGLMNRVVILVNKVTTILQNGVVSVEGNRITLPFDHTYQHVYQYGIYIMLKSKVLPFSVTWLSSSGGISSISVQLNQGLVEGMTGMCGRINSTENVWQLVSTNGISDGKCVTEDYKQNPTVEDCEVMSYAKECRLSKFDTYMQLCLQNMFPKVNINAKCAFIKEIVYLCGNKTHLWSLWRKITLCQEPSCPGDLTYQELGPAFPPTCSNPQPNSDALINTCLPPAGMVVNDRADDFRSVRVTDCPCVHGGKTYAPGQSIISKCQSCVCKEGKWVCSPNACPPRCIIEGQVVTTFDGKQYSLPGKCTYVAAKGLSWTVTIKFSHTDMSIEEMNLDVYNERYTFAPDGVKLGDISIADLSQTEHATVFWQSSMFVQVRTSFGMKMQVQVSPEIQLYLYMPPTERTKGLCGTYNNNTEDDFTTSSGIIENSARPFASSWTVGVCSLDDLPICMNTNNEIFAEDKCAQLTNTSGVFASCHDYVPVNTIAKACVQRICQCTSGLQKCLCVALGNYAKACASQGIDVGDWRAASSCSMTCRGNLRFSYTTQACNRTCRSLSGPDPACEAPGDPVEGCSCLQGSHLNAPDKCSPRALCLCHYPGGTVPPGAHVIDGRKCTCEDGNLQCSKACDCPHGKVCVHCTQAPVLTTQKTCKSLSQPLSHEENCTSGCYCPEGQYEDHNGSCVTKDKCTCEFSGAVYSSGQSVESNCRSCVCVGGKWDCKGEPCPGVCEVFGNGQYSTFDSKWYRFDGHCQYTLVEDASGLYQFAVRVESVPCCDEALTCSRSISVELQKEVTLTLRDMNVTQKMQAGWHLRTQPLYSVHTVGLHIIITVPELGLTVVWDKQTRVKVQLQARWKGRVRGLCGNFDGKVMNDLLTSSSSVVFGTLEFGNSWKAAVPPCSDATQEVFPCQRHSYCSAWAQRRCMIMHSDTFKDCHLKVDPAPYYEACVLESCSCEFEGKFLGFCTAVAAYAEACSTQNVCINWRTPDLCPVYCDYYNEEGQYSWHYEPCGQIKTCGKNNAFTGKLEGCYPRCPPEMPFYDENTRQCSSLDRCTCYFNSTVIGPGDSITTPNECCKCTGGNIVCGLCSATRLFIPEPTTKVPRTEKSTETPVYINTTNETTQTTTTSTTPQILTRTTKYITLLTTSTPVKITKLTPENRGTREFTIKYTTPPTTRIPLTTTTSTIQFSTPLTTTTPMITTSTTPHITITTEYTSTTSTPHFTNTTEEPITTYNRRAYNYSNYNYSINNLYNNPTHHKYNRRVYNFSNYNYTINNLYNINPTHHKYNRRAYNYSNYNYSSNNLYINPTHHKHNRRAYNSSNYNYSINNLYNDPTHHKYNRRAYNSSNLNYTSNNLYNINPTHHKYNRRVYNFSNYNYSINNLYINPTHHKYNRRTYNYSNYNYTINNLYNINPTHHKYNRRAYNYSNYNYTSNNLYINPTHHKYNRRVYNYSNYNYTSNNLYNINSTHHKYNRRAYNSSNYNYSINNLYINPTHHKYNRRAYNYSNYNYTINNLYINPIHHKYNRRAYNFSNYNYISNDLYNINPTHHKYNSRAYNSSNYNYTSNNLYNNPTHHKYNRSLRFCMNLMRNQTWPSGTEWTEDCFRKACRNGVIEMRPVTCPPQIIPQCPRDLMLQVKDEQGCCDIWQCNCQCDVYGDPHYVSFSGTSFDFMDNCTYVLVEEIKPRHHLSIVVDNYYCNSELFGSCAKGIILKYLGSVVTLQVNDNEYTVEATLNDRVVQPPHEENGIRFESGDYQVSVYIDEIRSRVSLTPANTLEIILAMEHFYENTQGQCGICGGASCVRRSGQIESDDCCDKTAYHWIEEDPAKLYCAHAPRNVPCSPVSPSTMPSLPPTTPSCVAPLCDLLRHELFHECAKNIDMEVLVQNCRFDYCLARSKSSMCSPLEHLAEQCKKMGFCVYWRNLTNGICNVTCPEGMNFDECHRTTNDVCHGGVRVPGKVMDNFHSGCFCPDNQLLADKHKKICVSECTNCRGPLGEPMPVGATWESNCHVCTCNNQTQTEECWPKPPAPTPTCSENSTLVLDCCNNQICVEKTCEYNGKTFKVGDVWTDQLEPCITLHCTSAGTEIERRVCPQQSCSEGLRVWDEDQCCYTCNITCSVQESRMTVMVENCKQEVTLPICEGFCQSHSMWVRSGEVLQLQQDPQCCQESSYEIRQLSLSCGGAMPTSYSYKHITGCECKSAS
ncbi:mucin-5AC-like [Electrophorus electricus]|uniref:mucin-5AC-like n=1 Tax=Electrophorus electricus TaxID=8005 RepID=UPI0015CFDCED|nr:mucin-5AC-like [Electrophorus electricus]